jgi:hypothetical protein
MRPVGAAQRAGDGKTDPFGHLPGSKRAASQAESRSRRRAIVPLSGVLTLVR